MRTLLRFALLTAAFALGTAVAGWWSVPVFAAIAGVLLRHVPRQAVLVGAAAAAAWAVLLLWTSTQGPVWEFAGLVGGALGASGVILGIVTLLFPALIAWLVAMLVQVIARGKAEAN